jgi:predicted metalloenzyme YecM
MTPEERFEHIETVLVRIAEAHLELETAQINAQKAHDQHLEESLERRKYIDEKIANLTILVDRLIARDLQ